MNAVLPIRSARAVPPQRRQGLRPILAAALLCAACTPEDSSRNAPPAAIVPPATAIAGTAPPTYISEHVAKDAALSEALLGTWAETLTGDDGARFESVIRYASDGTLSVLVSRADKPDARYAGKGTWSIGHGLLAYSMTLEGRAKALDGIDEILRIDQHEFVYVDGDNKKTKIATRVPDAAPAAAAAPSSAVPAPTVVLPSTEGELVLDERRFVAKEEVETVDFRLGDTAMVRLTAEIEERVPLNVIVLPGRITGDRFAMAFGHLTYGRIVSVFEDSKIKGVSTVEDLFASRLSKRAAYGRFDSPWVRLNAGTYTVLLDNWTELAPIRGDAPVHLRLFSRPVP